MYRATTFDIQITATPIFAPERSDAGIGRYFWTYTIEIANQGDIQVQLLERFWRITDANGRVETVNGPGVVGETPIIEPGESFSYTSGCSLNTASGLMSGSYRMVDANGRTFDAEIPPFSLDSPMERRILN
ncbi:Co2+/Mg2+ efflux protein ApaG [Rhodoblastus acidophilus]|uniref:Protein ApaG n=1 Tax=Candidatus Rhodoblastus alkanivorans TaxID=2954117 RepID=A0ABS9ZCI7_9HYPH|nr:Co2+/Mg2+ efflux protein ApaG [Candidatus Rhodoblastus alkanivorans]MCI4679351.1 Co2+/Mg2+ efflux protein ApaG [Candidatus Rhodoblastus alkanivorans]MCI4684827.1 Co2+/Mg2+ efflux protein ApaG [Candidatus Rhodoblastus alkanivorans]MDI4642151.1 Co2+/Mg2+ efflux protein ApaG [Rhodoblastus acidophilus]